MPVTIVADAGSAGANSFATRAEFVAYLDGRLNATAGSGATGANQDIALVEATRELTTKSWKGLRATDTQALAWPRQWADDPDSSVGGYYDSDVIPQRVKDATCELALQFLKAGTTDIAELPSTDGIISKTVDVLSTMYADPTKRRTGLSRFPSVMRFISPLLAGTVGSFQVIRG